MKNISEEIGRAYRILSHLERTSNEEKEKENI